MFEFIKLLQPPFAPLDIPPCVTVTLTPLSFEIGRMVIHPRFPGAPAEKEVEVVRIFVPIKEKIEMLEKIGELPPGVGATYPELVAAVPAYWDIAQRRLYPALLRTLQAPGWEGVKFELHKIGHPPKAFFSIRVVSREER